ncbi:phosphatidylinositol-specific phospholipase C/glycerophosphodiester phosphodiesterase family protein [Amycolatopsis roodepoortensis]|uniref:Altered inheritance of mitochondria protein 6 n=1 Tax=Amycolatopsis roodepoortensis TaxID=700274 RepID=A0ABR9L778_9PSEU|nr:phosphatidylinositol-specific phospholipase C/glycerophosphodiester phosphodiesterase family protein [Amycolatopsis roodepoortensis]MBE1576549.1 glycerophosphoryl diester phosphodiesterase [Amycolatopsis roodepoortensis]
MITPRRILAALLAAVAATSLATAPASAHERGVRPLPQAHSHNDYEHTRPLHDALDQGFTSVEADIFLVDGQLLVAHDLADTRPDRTLESLYLEPLRRRVLANHGVGVYRQRSEFQLLIDVKGDANSTYAALEKRLYDPRYSFLFSLYAYGHVKKRAVTAVISGGRPKDVMLGQKFRLAFYDGRIRDQNDLGIGSDPRVTPLVSDSWSGLFTWTGEGPFPAEERAKLHDLVKRAHAAGQRVRFWATPDTAGPGRDALWKELVTAGVDHLNTDDLPGLANFLRSR